MKIFVKVKPNARKNEVKKIDTEHYMISTVATPENGKANESIIELIADFFRIGKTKIHIVKGLTTKEKIIEIEDDVFF